MRARLTVDRIRTLPRSTDCWDTTVVGLVLRIRASGKGFYSVRYAGGKRVTLGAADALSPFEARRLARQALGTIASGRDPQRERRRSSGVTLRSFLVERYPLGERTSGATRVRVTSAFPTLLNRSLASLTAYQIEQWRTARRAAGTTDATINRDLNALRSVLSKALQWGVITDHPCRTVRNARVDAIARLRYLSDDEEQRLRVVLAARDEATHHGDHMTPVVLLALNTGLRRGELLALQWADVDLVGALLTVRGVSAKSGRTRRVPLNAEAVASLRRWRPDACEPTGIVFPGRDGQRMASLKTAWKTVATAARLEGFTFHSLRHTFASWLVQRGVDLNTVRELLGHADLTMTLRYAHLAPGDTARAVATLVR
jgi:integrase